MNRASNVYTTGTSNERQERREEHPAHDRDAERPARFAAGAEPDRDRQHAEDGRERRHQDRPQADARRFDHGLQRLASPRARSWFAYSTIRIAFFVTSPISMMSPIWE